MNYRPSSKSFYPRSLLLILILVSAVFFVLLNRKSIAPALTDFGRNLWQVKIKSFDFLGLRRGNGDSQNLEATVELLLAENQMLKEYFGRFSNYSYLLGVVLVRPPQIPYDILILDVGREKGVEPGDWVLVYPNVVLGKIIEVGEKTSRAALFSSTDQKINVLIGTSTFLAAQASGRGAGNFILELPAEFEVAIGTIVSLPKLEAYVLGRVREVEYRQGGSSQLVRFASPVNLNQLKWVFLAK